MFVVYSCEERIVKESKILVSFSIKKEPESCQDIKNNWRVHGFYIHNLLLYFIDAKTVLFLFE